VLTSDLCGVMDVMTNMEIETKYLRLFREVRLGDQIDGWRVCWLGGWDKCRVIFVVMVERVKGKPPRKQSVRRPARSPQR
jgi:hypothetical protein